MLIDLHLHTSTKWIFPHYIGISRPFHLPRNSIKLPITVLQCLRLRTEQHKANRDRAAAVR